MAQRFAGLTTGSARFAADVPIEALHLVFVRSTIPHGRLVTVDVGAAEAMPGVVAVFTARSLPTVPVWEIMSIPEVYAQPGLADGTVRYVGERIAAVVAETLAAALDAAEGVVVEYEPLPAVVNIEQALDPATPPVIEASPSNVVLSWTVETGEHRCSTDEVVVRTTFDLPRVAVAPLEGHSVVAVPGSDGRLTVHVSTQAPQGTRVQIARSTGLALDRVRVVTPNVGGGFGGKAIGGVPDHVVTAAAALALGRPVRFVEDRSGNLLSMQGRGARLAVEVHADHDGRLLWLRLDDSADAGAYPSTGAVEPGKTTLMACGPYRIDAVHVTARSVTTNLAPTGAYRGPGRAEAAAALERALDLLARRLGLDPAEVRRRNLLRPDELPRLTPTGTHLADGDYPAVLERLLAEAGYSAVRDRQATERATAEAAAGAVTAGSVVAGTGAGAASDSGRLVGIGLATVVDSTAWFARREPAALAIGPDGTIVLTMGTAAAGQEHAIVFAGLVAETLGVSVEDIMVIEGDTDAEPDGMGSSGSRSLQLGGSAARQVAGEVLERARRLAAEALEAPVGDVVVVGGRLGVRGVPARSLSYAELAALATQAGDGGLVNEGVDGAGRLEGRCVYEQLEATHPFAAHCAVVEVDVETGAVTLVRLIAVTDCGTVVDHPSADGQVIGASVQGLAQALFEEFRYDAGIPLTTSLAEYLVPSAAEMPSIGSLGNTFAPTVATTNPLGAKGVGEIGTIAAPIAVHAALLDAVASVGVDQIGYPCSPERVWRAMGNGW